MYYKHLLKNNYEYDCEIIAKCFGHSSVVYIWYCVNIYEIFLISEMFKNHCGCHIPTMWPPDGANNVSHNKLPIHNFYIIICVFSTLFLNCIYKRELSLTETHMRYE